VQWADRNKITFLSREREILRSFWKTSLSNKSVGRNFTHFRDHQKKTIRFSGPVPPNKNTGNTSGTFAYNDLASQKYQMCRVSKSEDELDGQGDRQSADFKKCVVSDEAVSDEACSKNTSNSKTKPILQ